MAEKSFRSKLKRNKPGGRDPAVPPLTEPLDRGPGALSRGEPAAEPGRSGAPAVAWWDSGRLPAAEALWALTLRCALPGPENPPWDLLPDLPHPSPARPAALKSDEPRWCDLSEEVAPLPEPAPPSPRTSWSPDPPGLGSSQQELSVRTEPAPESSHSRLTHNDETKPRQAPANRPRLSLHRWEAPASSSRPSGVGGDEGGGREAETGPVNRLLTDQVKASDSRASLPRAEERREEEEVQRRVRGGGGLQSCPMCLLEFPVGFTQMDCDGHLAQCLSEVNVDMTW